MDNAPEGRASVKHLTFSSGLSNKFMLCRPTEERLTGISVC